MQTSTACRLKRKSPAPNAAANHSLTKKLDVTKSTEFELREQYERIRLRRARSRGYSRSTHTASALSSLVSNDSVDRENDVDDFADRLFNYLDETCAKPLPSPHHAIDCNPINPVAVPQSAPAAQRAEQEIKPLLCAFCPYTAQNIHEFQTHIAKHTEKNFRCLLCNCMYKYRRDCVTHMKRKHASTVTGSISQYIQKITNPPPQNASVHPSSSTPTTIQPTSSLEPKRYGCPYCSLMTKSTSSIYKHQSRKHASFPKIVHKYSTDDPSTRSLVAILQQKSIKKSAVPLLETEVMSKSPLHDESMADLSSSSSCSSFLPQHAEPFPLANQRQYPPAQIRLSNVSADCEFTEQPNQSEETSDKLFIDCDETEGECHTSQLPSCSLNTIVQAPLLLHSANGDNQPGRSYADIHLSINIFLPKRKRPRRTDRPVSDGSRSRSSSSSETSGSDEQRAKIQVSSSPLPNLSGGSLYKPHKCRRCFYRSNWKTDMLHHIRLKHQIEHASKSDYLSMDAECALRSFSTYEQTFGKVLKNRLLLPKIDYVDCTWEELQSKLFIHNNENRTDRPSASLSALTKTSSTAALNNDESDLFRDDNHTPRF